MSQLGLFGILVLVCYRLTRLLVQDLVPFGWLRDRLFEKFGPKSKLVELSGCPHCAGIWTSAFLVLVTNIWLVPLPLPVYWWGALAGTTSIIASILNKVED